MINESILICPYCKMNIPLMEFEAKEGEIVFRMKCPCLDKEKTFTISEMIQEFNIKEAMNKEIIINSKCSGHNEKYVSYCKECALNQCSKCLVNHCNNHTLIPLNDYNTKDFSSKTINEIEEIIEDNQRRKEKFIEDINVQINALQSKIEYLTLMRETILLAYVNNYSINTHLKEFMQIISNTAIAINDSPNYELMSLHHTINVNPFDDPNDTNTISNNECNSEVTYFYFLHHLQYNFALIQYSPFTKASCVNQLVGHTRGIWKIIQLTDGRLATCSIDATIKIWDLNTLECLHTFKDHKYAVNCIIQLDNEHLLSGSWDYTIKLWDLSKYHCEDTLNGHSKGINCLLLTSKGTVYSGSSDNTIKVWDIPSRTILGTLNRHTSYVYALIELPNGQIASGGDDKMIFIWDPNTFQCTSTLKAHDKLLLDMIMLQDTKQFASCSADSKIKFWDAKLLKCNKTLTGHTTPVNCLFQMKNGYLISGAKETNNTMKVWEMNSYQCIMTMKHKIGNISTVIETKDGRIISGHEDMTITIWKR